MSPAFDEDSGGEGWPRWHQALYPLSCWSSSASEGITALTPGGEHLSRRGISVAARQRRTDCHVELGRLVGTKGCFACPGNGNERCRTQREPCQLILTARFERELGFGWRCARRLFPRPRGVRNSSGTSMEARRSRGLEPR